MSSKSKTTARPASAAGTVMPEQDQKLAPKRVSVFINIGSLGSDFATTLAERNPEIKEKILAIDTARPTAMGQDQVELPAWQLLLPNPDVKKPAQSRQLTLLNDGMIPDLEYPGSASNGAAQVRLFGMIKFAEAVPKVRGRIRQLLGQALRESNGRPLQVVITSSICGGTGSAMILPLALLARDEARMVSFGATIDVFLLAVLPSYFLSNPDVQQTDRERLRLSANAAATLREIKFAQTSSNSLPLQKALGINPRNPITTPPISAIYFYGSEATGGTLTPEKLSDRLAAAALTLTHPSLAEIDKNLMSNASGQYWGAFGRPEHSVVAASADRVAWLPPAMRDLYAHSCLTEALNTAVRKGETEQIEGLMRNFKARLGLGGIEGGIQQAIGELVPAGNMAVDPEIAKRSDQQAMTQLTNIQQCFKNEVTPKLVATARAKLREIELVLVPAAVQRVGDEILAEIPSLDMVREVCESLARHLTEVANSHAAGWGRLKQEDHGGRLREAIAQIGKNTLANFTNRGTLRVQAGQACEEWKQAQQEHLTLKLREQTYRLTAQHFQALAMEITGRLSRLRERLGETNAHKEEARRAAVAATDALCSIIRPEEATPFLQRIRHGIEVSLGESPTPLSPARLMQPGIDNLLDEYLAECGNRYDGFLRNHLKSLSGAVVFGRLNFSLTAWAQSALANLTMPVPLDFLPVGGEGNAPNHQYLAAGGQEYTTLQEMKAARPKLRGLSVINSGDPFFVVARHRYAGLPFAALPIADCLAAAEHFDEENQKVAVNVLTSSGWLLPARFEPLSGQDTDASGASMERDENRLDPRVNGESLGERFVTRV